MICCTFAELTRWERFLPKIWTLIKYFNCKYLSEQHSSPLCHSYLFLHVCLDWCPLALWIQLPVSQGGWWRSWWWRWWLTPETPNWLWQSGSAGLSSPSSAQRDQTQAKTATHHRPTFTVGFRVFPSRKASEYKTKALSKEVCLVVNQ